MKTLNLFVVAFFAILLISCSSDDNNAGDVNKSPKNILEALNSSLQKYNDAEVNSWVEITKSEYESLANLKSVTKVGISDNLYVNDVSKLEAGAFGYTEAGFGGTISKIPQSSYIYAFKYVNLAEETRINDQVKYTINDDPKLGYMNLGSKLPSHTGIGEHFFVIKSDATRTATTKEGHLGFYSTNKVGWYNIEGIKNAYAAGNQSDITDGVEDQNYQYQALSTTEVQW